MLGNISNEERSCWFYGKNGKSAQQRTYHRVGGPAYKEGYDLHCIGGMIHDLNSPAYYTDMAYEYSLGNNEHCITGPSRFIHGYARWFVNDIEYTEEEFNRIMKVNGKD